MTTKQTEALATLADAISYLAAVQDERDDLMQAAAIKNATIDSLTVQRDAAEALARSVREALHPVAGNLLDNGHSVVEVVGTTVATVEGLRSLRDRLESQVADLTASMEHQQHGVDVLVGQRDTAEAEAFKNAADRDAAQQMVAEMRAAMDDVVQTIQENHIGAAHRALGALTAALALSAPIAGRWCLASERDAIAHDNSVLQSVIRADATQIAAATARAEKAERKAEVADIAAQRALSLTAAAERRDSVLEAQLFIKQQESESFARISDVQFARTQEAERRESELGVQVEAQKARLRLADGVIATLRQEGGSDSSADVRALAAWDAVPGDQGGEG